MMKDAIIMKKLKVAVMLSAYNGEKYIQEQIESIFRQQKDGFDIDLYIRDDGSNDRTKKICEKYFSREDFVYISDRNIGVSKSFLKLILLADGYDYYAFSDQDDVWDDNKIISAVKALEHINRPALYFSDARIADSDCNEIGINVYKTKPKLDFYTLSCAGDVLGCTVVFNNLLARIIQMTPPEGEIVMHDFFMALVCKAIGGEIIYDPISTLRYRQHGGNVVGIGKNKFDNIIKQIKYIILQKKSKIDVQARTVYTTYDKYILNDYKSWLKFVSNYNNNIISRLKLACSRRTVYKNLHMSLKTRLEILCGNR